MNSPTDSFSAGDIAELAADFRAGRTTMVDAARACLDRIERLDSRLGAFMHVAGESAMATAAALDGQLANGTDLGPLMGVPIGVKDIFAVDGMPTTNGSLHECADITGGEGGYVRRLKQAGCVILGKTRTVEFAIGLAGLNEARGTPWNPWDPAVHRSPGGSSSGSAVATAAGMCLFGVGSDTGGSIRIPAAFNGLAGHKTTVGLLPTDGAFPLSPTLDSVGALCRSATDAAIVHAATVGVDVPKPRPPGQLRLGRPKEVFFDDLDPEVEACVDAALERLSRAGVTIVPADTPDLHECQALLPAIVEAELASACGRARFEAARAGMDRYTAAHVQRGFERDPDAYAAAIARQRELARTVTADFQGLDGWICPTCPMVPMPVHHGMPADQVDRAMLCSRNTRPANLWGACAVTVPVHHLGSVLPVGLQVICPPNRDAEALSIALTLEAVLSRPAAPDLSAFLA